MAGNISQNLNLLKIQMLQSMAEIAQDVAVEASEDVISLQEKETFWNNQTFKALGSIGSDSSQEGRILKMSVGFINGEPSENRKDGAREYGQYIAEYQRGIGNTGIHFLGACLNALVKRFNEKMQGAEIIKATKATYTGSGNWEQQ